MINPKVHNIGDVVYYIKKNGCKWTVDFGTVIDNYSDAVCIQLYELVDSRTIDGVPIKEFKTPTRFQKLPKGCTYNTELFKLGWDNKPRELPADVCAYFINKKDDIKKLIECGWLVKVQDNDDARIETEITKDGWRLVRKYDNKYRPTYLSIIPSQVYDSHGEACEVVAEHDAELKRQSELSDYDWSVEQIDKTLNHAEKLSYITDYEKEQYREWLLSKERVEDIETRVFNCGVQWKYWKNSRWINIAL